VKELLENLIREDELFRPFNKEELLSIRLRHCTKNPDGTYSCRGDLDLSGLGLTKLPVKFKRVEGSFRCRDNKLVCRTFLSM